MNNTIANRDSMGRMTQKEQGDLPPHREPDISQRARLLACAVLRLHEYAISGARVARFATPAEVAIAEGVIAEVPDLRERAVRLEHYRAQGAARSR
jgi:hypothetical protein